MSSSASCLAPPPPRLPSSSSSSSRASLPPPSYSSSASASAARFGPRRRAAAAAAPAKGWRLVRVSCFRQEDFPTTSDDGAGFEHISRPESSRGAEASGEGSSGQGERSSEEGNDWFVRAQEIKRNLQERIFRFQTQQWTVPWTGKTIAQDHQGGKHPSGGRLDND